MSVDDKLLCLAEIMQYQAIKIRKLEERLALFEQVLPDFGAAFDPSVKDTHQHHHAASLHPSEPTTPSAASSNVPSNSMNVDSVGAAQQQPQAEDAE